MRAFSPEDVLETRSLGGEATYLRLKDGRELVLKGVPRQERERWRPGRAWTELVALDLLAAAGAPVPQLLAADTRAGWLLRQYIPGPPLGTVLLPTDPGPGPTPGPADIFRALADGLRRIEQVLAAAAAELAPHVDDVAHATWKRMAARLESLLAPEAADAWQELVREALDPAALTLGPLDIHAGNAVWHEGRVYFVDFATLGPDFPERRLAAYGQAVRPKAASALTAEVYAAYAEEAGPRAALRLAVFDLLFWGVVLQRLRIMTEQPESPDALRLRREWGEAAALSAGAIAQWHRERVPDARLAAVVAGLQW